MYENLWIIEWDDRGRDGEAIDTATTPDDAVAVVRRFLEHETTFDEEMEGDRPALDVLFDGCDPVKVLAQMDDRIEIECENGDFLVRRTMRFVDAPPETSITTDMVRRLKEDYLSWSGGFRPDEHDQVAVYVANARPSDIGVADAWAIIHEWIADAQKAETCDSAEPNPNLVIRQAQGLGASLP